jgi:multiple sugar transport system permease protein/cellobiose transport system permease protein
MISAMTHIKPFLSKIKTPLALLPVSILSLIPLYFILSMATHNTSEIYRGDIFTPGAFLFTNLKTVLSGGFIRYFGNSFIVSLGSVFLCLFISSLAAYGITIYQFGAKKWMAAFIFATMMIPGQISILGFVIEMRNLNLINSLFPLILTWGASSYGVYFMMQYMKNGIPLSLVESARIDGCGEFRTYCMIGLPMIRPAVGALSMLVFLWSWNSLLLPSTLINQSARFTIPIGIQTLATAYTQNWGARAGALAVAIIPILLIFIAGSKYFIHGIAAGAIKE